MAGNNSWIYSTEQFRIQTPSWERDGPRRGDVYTCTKHHGQKLMCIDNSIRFSPNGKRECTVIALTTAGIIAVSPPTATTVLGRALDDPSFNHITPDQAMPSLVAHYSAAEKHLKRASPQPCTPERLVEHSDPQVFPAQVHHLGIVFSPRSVGLDQDVYGNVE